MTARLNVPLRILCSSAFCLLLSIELGWGQDAKATPGQAVASLDAMLHARHDLWGEAAMREPNGASYEFFENLLPPPRYVNADFRFYPISLSAPNSEVKARLISNGSGMNLDGGSKSWHHVGTPVTFRVGPDEFLFGGIRERAGEPTLAEGYLPIVEIRYLHPSPVNAAGKLALNQGKVTVPAEVYRLEAFASTDCRFSSNGVVFVRFDLVQGTNGIISVEVDPRNGLSFSQGKILDQSGRVLASFDSQWKWDGQLAQVQLRPGRSAVLVIATKPLEPEVPCDCSAETYDAQRELCAETWRRVLGDGMSLQTPEPIVNHAWRHLLIQNFELINRDQIRYSAGNQYDKLYESEGSDAAMAMLAWGFEKDTRRLIPALLDFTRKNLEAHQAGFKLNDIARYYWVTRDAQFVRSMKPRWEKELHLLADCRTNEVGLCPKQQYCGDISTMVYSLSVNAKGWRALRDFSAILEEIGEPAAAQRYAETAAAFKKAVLAAIDKSVHKDVNPPFVPIALYADEPAPSPITDTRIGSYWNLVIGYVIGSGIFPPGSEEETWIPRYLEENGGLCMGMLRAGGGQYTFWSGPYRVNPLYGTRYTLDALRRDDPERSLVSFYGMLAQGFTRNTFISGEGCCLTPLDEGGRFFYCPPNSAANAHFLSILRNLLVQDWDLDDDGKPDTLRLCFATPKRWLEDGKTIEFERAPTAFGPVSVRLESKLSTGEVVARVDPPHRNPPAQTYLRVRLPEGWQAAGAEMSSHKLPITTNGTLDISSLHQPAAIRVKVSRTTR